MHNETLFFEAGLGDSHVDVSVQGEEAINSLLELGILVGSWGEDEYGGEVVLLKPYHPKLWEEVVYRLHLADAEMRLSCPTQATPKPQTHPVATNHQPPRAQDLVDVAGQC